MPELPEVEIVKQGLNQLTLNKRILGGEVLLERTLAHPISVADFLRGLEGKAIAQWHRQGKYLLAQLYKCLIGKIVSICADSWSFFACDSDFYFYWAIRNRKLEAVIQGNSSTEAVKTGA